MHNNSLNATVLMAVYNDEIFLEQSLESILQQLTEDMELLIIDDHSSDRSWKILQEMERQDSRVRLIRNAQNQGLGYCLSIGTEKARGKYVIRIDSDDVCLPDRFAKQIRFLDQNPDVDIVGGAAIEINEHGETGLIRKMPYSHEQIKSAIWACPLIHPTIAFRRQEILRSGNYDPEIRRRQDYDLWFRCLKAGLRFANLPDALIYYRFTAKSQQKHRLSQAIDQAKIGWRGCRMLKLPWWQYLAVMVPILRAIFPPSLSHLIYRWLAPFDPRKKYS
ncbi:glycosyltransferase [Anabaena sp. CS-542/02]|uniref:glycosyltransferase n=1 Tax=Anabaena sp. CS-542/02 TaxID=3021719 RepID=UPI00232E264D|nr:glycosyltransferase [Anabaena sp. CS-542/02]MDB9444789.1 glycosyltransferase [Anabaena sp. CS-542/02]